MAGHQVERALFGEFLPPSETPPPLPANNEIMFQEIISRHEHPDFPIDPEDPREPFASALLQKIQELTGSSTMRFYTSTGSRLDWHLGIDGFLQDNGIRVTIDIKTSDQTAGKADLIENVPDVGLDPERKPTEFNEYVDRLARRVVQKFKIQQRAH